jgi:diaminopimelate epimerase
MKFEKYHGLGNDFLITENLALVDNPDYIKKICNRYTGIGADGLMIVKKTPLEMIFFNQDGTRGEMCGNGIRCFSYYCYLHNIINSDKFDVLTLDGIKHLEIKSKDPFVVKVDMGKMLDKYDTYCIEFNGIKYQTYNFFFGVPHTVIYANEVPTENLGKYISNHEHYQNKTNVNFVKVEDDNNIRVATWERGCGYTLGCGTGMTASAIICNYLGKVNKSVNAKSEGGCVKIDIEDFVYMIGPAVKICEGTLEV